MAEHARVLLVAKPDGTWRDVVADLCGEGFAFEVVDPAAAPADVAARAGESVVLVDLSPDLVRGMEMVAACRRSAPAAPVVAVAENPSVELAKSIRESGVFYLALHPVAADEIRTILGDALRSMGRNKPSSSTFKTRKRVLIVDDDADYCASVTALLEREGYLVHCAASAREGLAHLSTDRPDLIVLDVMMEDAFAGYGLNQAVKFGDKREVAGHVPVLMVSSIEQPPEAIFPAAAEAAMITPDDYLTKPLDIPVFLDHVRRLLALPGRIG
ncbi:MAG: response regulator [Acidobacteriia bacterium]|nr:response regulator [Terriglobia bacterium]